MIIRHISFKRRLIRAICVGIGISILIPELLAAFLLPTSWVGYTDMPQDTRAPTYLSDIAPAFTNAYKNIPADPTGSDPLYGGINLGLDIVNYNYGVGFFDPNFVPWDPTVTDTPGFVNITRFRFGYPFRALTWDDLSTGTSVNIPAVMEYHIKMYDRAGIYRGIGVSFISPGLRLPISPIWGGLTLDVLVWGSAWYFPGAIFRRIRILRRRRRRRRGLCIACAYVLDDFERCPECGTDRAVDIDAIFVREVVEQLENGSME